MSFSNLKSRGLAVIAGAAFIAAATAGPAYADMSKYDADNSGGLSASEYIKMSASKLKTRDADKDGALSLEEYMSGEKGNAKKLERAAARFAKKDKDGNGALDKKEIKRMVKGRFKYFDKDADGEITEAELSAKKGKKKKDK